MGGRTVPRGCCPRSLAQFARLPVVVAAASAAFLGPGSGMSRTRRAGITAVFGFAQFGLALVSGIAMVPFILSRVPTEHYGVWLAFGEVLAYSSMVDLGVVGVVPWLLAESDGR